MHTQGVGEGSAGSVASNRCLGARKRESYAVHVPTQCLRAGVAKLQQSLVSSLTVLTTFCKCLLLHLAQAYSHWQLVKMNQGCFYCLEGTAITSNLAQVKETACLKLSQAAFTRCTNLLACQKVFVRQCVKLSLKVARRVCCSLHGNNSTHCVFRHIHLWTT